MGIFKRHLKLIVASLCAIAALAAFWAARERLTLSELAQFEQALLQLRKERPILVYGLAFLLYVCVTGLSLPGATVLSLAYGWYFGFWRALVAISFASTSGATLALLISRYLLREAVQQRFGHRLEGFHEALQREGAFYLFTLRLLPLVPFFVINLVMGLTPLRVRTFWWVSQLGMLPGTCVYVYAGSQFPTLRQLADQGAAGVLTPGLVLAFILLGLFPLLLRWLLKWLRRPGLQSQQSPAVHSAEDSQESPP